MRIEANLAEHPEDYNAGLGAIFSGGPRITLPGSSTHDVESRERQDRRKFQNLTFTISTE